MRYSIDFLKALAICIGFFSFAACKERSVIKPDLIPEVDNINTFQKNIEDFNLNIQTGYFDSIRTDDVDYPVVTLGGIANDSFFGKTNAGFYFQIGLPGSNFYFPNDLTRIDSVVLTFPSMIFAYGDTAEDRNAVSVYKITDDNFGVNDSANSYYSFSSVSTESTPIASDIISYFSVMHDTILYPTGQIGRKLLRIHLPVSFGDMLKNADTSYYRDNKSFKSLFKGFYIAGDTTNSINNRNWLAYLNLGSLDMSNLSFYNYPRLEIFYTKTDNSKSIILFPYTPDTRFFSKISRNYSSKPAQKFLTGVHDSIVVQSSPGIYTDITLNNLQDIPKSIINKAQLTLTLLNVGDDNTFAYPDILMPYGISSAGSVYKIADFFNNSNSSPILSNLVDGLPKKIILNNKSYVQYKLNFPRELQNAILSGKNSLTLRIMATSNYPGAFRMVADGINGGDDTKLTFDVIYTKLN